LDGVEKSKSVSKRVMASTMTPRVLHNVRPCIQYLEYCRKIVKLQSVRRILDNHRRGASCRSPNARAAVISVG